LLQLNHKRRLRLIVVTFFLLVRLKQKVAIAFFVAPQKNKESDVTIIAFYVAKKKKKKATIVIAFCATTKQK